MPLDSLDNSFFFFSYLFSNAFAITHHFLLSGNLVSIHFTYAYKPGAASTGSSTDPDGICLISLFF